MKIRNRPGIRAMCKHITKSQDAPAGIRCPMGSFRNRRGISGRGQLENVVFSDGGTASGTIDLNVYGYVVSGDIITTTGTLLTGSDYVFPSSPSSGYSSGVFSGFAGAYNLVLYLDVAQPFSAIMSGADAITEVAKPTPLLRPAPPTWPAAAIALGRRSTRRVRCSEPVAGVDLGQLAGGRISHPHPARADRDGARGGPRAG